MQGASGKPTEQIKTEKANPAHAIFDIVTKDPEGPHIPDDVHPATMQKYRRQQGEVVWMQCHRPETARREYAGLARARKRARHNAPLIKDSVKSSRAHAEFEEKHASVYHNEPYGHGGETHGRDSIAQWKHTSLHSGKALSRCTLSRASTSYGWETWCYNTANVLSRRSLMNMCPGACVRASTGFACIITACGVTPQAQNTGTSPAATGIASPKSGRCTLRMPRTVGSPTWMGAPCTAGKR